jgi:hypothetical protein
MKIYVLSFYSVAAGSYITLGAYSSEEKARAVMESTFSENESLSEIEPWPDGDTYFYTNECTYRIESFTLDN